MKFLYAHWKHLLLANYSMDGAVLEKYRPAGTVVDSFEGHVFVSLVAFLFDKTRVLGLPVPFHRRFEEVNLRFYVTPEKDPSIRGVTFVKEIVPKGVIPLVANTFFHENYVKLPMDHGLDGDRVWYTWGRKPENKFSAKINSVLDYPAAGSIGEFITEHYWGYAKGPRQTLEYRVEHPQWTCCDVTDFEIDVSFAKTYGDDFAFLDSMEPHNVQYALGSDVSVSFPSRLN